MSLRTIFDQGALQCTVKHGATELYAGGVGLSAVETFTDTDGLTTCTLSTDAAGVVTYTAGILDSDPHSVEFAVPSGATSANLADVSTANATSPVISAVADGSNTDFTSASYAFPTLPASTFGCAMRAS